MPRGHHSWLWSRATTSLKSQKPFPGQIPPWLLVVKGHKVLKVTDDYIIYEQTHSGMTGCNFSFCMLICCSAALRCTMKGSVYEIIFNINDWCPNSLNNSIHQHILCLYWAIMTNIASAYTDECYLQLVNEKKNSYTARSVNRHTEPYNSLWSVIFAKYFLIWYAYISISDVPTTRLDLTGNNIFLIFIWFQYFFGKIS